MKMWQQKEHYKKKYQMWISHRSPFVYVTALEENGNPEQSECLASDSMVAVFVYVLYTPM